MYGPAFFAYAKTKALISYAVIVQLISTFFFVTWIDLFFYENFPIKGFTALIFPIRKALGPLPNFVKKIPELVQSP